MAISPAVDQEPELTTAPTPGQPRQSQNPQHGTFRLVLLGVLVLALLASAGCLIWLLAERRGAAGAEQSDRDAVMRQTEQFVLRLNTYGPDQLDSKGHLPDYEKQVEDVITPKFATDFEKSGLPIAEQTVAQASYARKAEVFGVGVESVDGDTATAIVSGSLTGSYPDPKHPKDTSKRVAADPQVLRWEVDLVRTHGTWQIDDYAPVSSKEAQQ